METLREKIEKIRHKIENGEFSTDESREFYITEINAIDGLHEHLEKLINAAEKWFCSEIEEPGF